MVSPGMTPTPPVTTRVGIPSVCESTALMVRLVRMLSPWSVECWVSALSNPFEGTNIQHSAGGDVGEGRLRVLADLGLVLCRQRAARRAGRSTVALPGDVDRELDRLHELGPRVPAEHRHEVAVQLARLGDLPLGDQGV